MNQFDKYESMKTEQAKGVELLIMNYDPQTGDKL